MPPGPTRAAADTVENAILAARLARELPGFLQAPLTVEEARQRVRRRLRGREQRFLRLMDRAVFARPRSPYLALLRHAGCEAGDLHGLVAREGLDGALHRLAEAGVYVRFDEFKGRRPAVRGSARFDFSDRDFDNRLVRGHYVVLSGGSRGRPTRVLRSLGSVDELAASAALVLDAHGIRRPRNLFWLGGPLTWALIHFRLGQSVDAWFYPIEPMPWIARAATAYVALLARQAGHRLPPARYCGLQRPEPILDWLACHAAPDVPILVNGPASSAVRIATAAAARGQPLTNVVFQCRMEPLSASRRRLIEETGARALSDYASVEVPGIGQACLAGRDTDDVHLWEDRHAVVAWERPIFAGGPTVRPLLFTSLSPHAPKLALNVELGDSARIERRDCGCPLGRLGLQTHLSEIRSFEKLSSEGTSFARVDLLKILEVTLPARFGGSALHYQVIEEEGPDGSARLVLRIDPAVGPLDEAAVRATLLAALGQGGLFGRHQARLLASAETIVVRRLPPIQTSAGKVLPFHLAGRTQAGPDPGGAGAVKPPQP